MKNFLSSLIGGISGGVIGALLGPLAGIKKSIFEYLWECSRMGWDGIIANTIGILLVSPIILPLIMIGGLFEGLYKGIYIGSEGINKLIDIPWVFFSLPNEERNTRLQTAITELSSEVEACKDNIVKLNQCKEKVENLAYHIKLEQLLFVPNIFVPYSAYNSDRWASLWGGELDKLAQSLSNITQKIETYLNKPNHNSIIPTEIETTKINPPPPYNPSFNFNLPSPNLPPEINIPSFPPNQQNFDISNAIRNTQKARQLLESIPTRGPNNSSTVKAPTKPEKYVSSSMKKSPGLFTDLKTSFRATVAPRWEKFKGSINSLKDSVVNLFTRKKQNVPSKPIVTSSSTLITRSLEHSPPLKQKSPKQKQEVAINKGISHSSVPRNQLTTIHHQVNLMNPKKKSDLAVKESASSNKSIDLALKNLPKVPDHEPTSKQKSYELAI